MNFEYVTAILGPHFFSFQSLTSESTSLTTKTPELEFSSQLQQKNSLNYCMRDRRFESAILNFEIRASDS